MITHPVLDVTAANGVTFRALFCAYGVAGPNPYRHRADDDATVEFYDTTRADSVATNGQFVSSYYATTLLGLDGSKAAVSGWPWPATWPPGRSTPRRWPWCAPGWCTR